MLFRVLRIIGFKSFFDPVEFTIEAGLTGIVGPNGCGKSNLFEALCWVMGEGNARQMRSHGMDDVISAGTEERQPRSYAEVILTLDNCDKSAPEIYNQYDSLQVSRRIVRDGGSTYRINGREVRARDVQLLFADAASGAQSPALIRQGRIQSLLQMKPQARRTILEEAAGITGLYTRRQEIGQKLKATRQNLERVEDVLIALRQQAEGLQVQAKTASEYRRLSAHIRNLKLAWFDVSRNYQEKKYQKLTHDYQAITRQSTLCESEILQLEQQQEQQSENLQKSQKEAVIATALLQKSVLDRQAIQQNLDFIKESYQKLQCDLDTSRKDHIYHQDMLADMHRQQKQIQQDLQDCHPEKVADLKSRSQILETECTSLEAAIAEYERSYQAVGQKISDLRSQKIFLEQQEKKLHKTIIQLQEQQTLLQKQYTQLQSEIADNKQIEVLQHDIDALEIMINELQTQLSDLRQSMQEQQFSCQEVQEQLQKQESQLYQHQAEQKALEDLQIKYSKTVSKDALIFQIQVEDGFENALAAVMGDSLEYGLDRQEAAWWRETIGHPTLSNWLPPECSCLKDHVTAPECLHLALSVIAVVSDAQKAEELWPSLPVGTVLVTRQGQVWRWDGFCRMQDDNQNIRLRLEQRNRLQSVKAALEDIRPVVEKQKHLLGEYKKQIATMQQQEKQQQQQQQQANQQLMSLTKKKLELQRQFDQKNNQCHQISVQLDDIQKNLEHHKQQQQQTEKQLVMLSEEKNLQDQYEKLRTQTLEQQNLLLEKRALHKQWHSDIVHQQQQYEKLQKSYLQGEERLKNLEKQSFNFENRQILLQQEGQQQQKKQQELSEQLTKINLSQKELKTREHSMQTNLQDAQNQAQAFTSQLSKIRKQHVQHKEHAVRLQEQLHQNEEKREELAHKFQQSYPELSEIPVIKDPQMAKATPKELEEALTHYQRERNALGAVNLVAEEDLKKLCTEQEVLQQQQQDLVIACRKLERGIADLNGQSSVKLQSAFDKVNSYFRTIFQQLFQGGSGELTLVDSDNILEAGLEITACPPGKRTRSLNLLSGGEQTLTCLALIFAVFLCNPAPICVLDEVDAPLDDANVQRFCHLLSYMRGITSARFLVITHNPMTMVRMDRLYGITMQERGVSRLVSVNLQDALEMVEQAA